MGCNARHVAYVIFKVYITERNDVIKRHSIDRQIDG